MVSQIAVTCARKFSLLFHKSTSAAPTRATAATMPAKAARAPADSPLKAAPRPLAAVEPLEKNPTTELIAPPIVLNAETTFPIQMIKVPNIAIIGPAAPMISAAHLTQPSTGRLSQIVPRTRTTLSLNVMIVCFMFSISCLILASLLPRPATKFSAAAFMELNDPETVVLASLAVVPVTPSLS